MRSIVSIIAILSFITLAVFGFVAMRSQHGGDEFCLSNILNTSGCLARGNTFSLAVIQTAVIAVILLLSLVFAYRTLPSNFLSVYALAKTLPRSTSSFYRQVLEYLTLHEKRDPSHTL